MYWGSEKERNAEVRKRIESRRDAAAAFPHLRKTLETFNGKVLNCRLEKALREDGNYWAVDIKRNDRYGDLICIKFGKSGSSCNEWHVVCSVNLGSAGEKGSKWDGKRIPAAVLVEAARETRENLLKEAADLENSIEKIPEYEKQLKYFKAQIDNIVSQIPPAARYLYNLEYRVINS